MVGGGAQKCENYTTTIVSDFTVTLEKQIASYNLLDFFSLIGCGNDDFYQIFCLHDRKLNV